METAVRWGGVCLGRHGGDCCEMGWSVYGVFEGRHGETAVRWGGVCLGALRAMTPSGAKTALETLTNFLGQL